MGNYMLIIILVSHGGSECMFERVERAECTLGDRKAVRDGERSE